MKVMFKSEIDIPKFNEPILVYRDKPDLKKISIDFLIGFISNIRKQKKGDCYSYVADFKMLRFDKKFEKIIARHKLILDRGIADIGFFLYVDIHSEKESLVNKIKNFLQ